MIYFNNDYSEGCHSQVLNKLIDEEKKQDALQSAAES